MPRLPTVSKAKVTSHPAAPLSHIANPVQRFSHIHIDLVGLSLLQRMATLRGGQVNTLGRGNSASFNLGGELRRRLDQWLGVPKQVTSDRGRQFCSSVWDALTRQLGVKMRNTTLYHPQSNELVERFHRCLKDALRARMAVAD